MRREALVKEIAVFPGDGQDTVLIDRVEVLFSVRRRSANSVLSQAELSTTRDLGMRYAVRVQHRHVELWWLVRWRRRGMVFEFRIPRTRTRELYTIALKVTFNPLRMLRQKLTEAQENLHRAPPDAKDNVIDPRVVSPEIVHRQLLRMVPRVVRQLRVDFLSIHRTVFGADVPMSDVVVSVPQFELAWDRACDAADTALHAFTPAWLAAVPRALKRFEFRHEGRGPHIELWGTGVLKAKFREGWIPKLYAPPGGILRFECQLTGTLARELVGHRLRMTNRKELRDDLRELAKQVYRPMPMVQQALSVDDVPDATALLTALVPARSRRLAAHIAGQLVAFGQVRCSRATPSVYKVMCRMRAVALMMPLHPGYWGPTPVFALLIQATVRQTVVQAGR